MDPQNTQTPIPDMEPPTAGGLNRVSDTVLAMPSEQKIIISDEPKRPQNTDQCDRGWSYGYAT